MPTSVALKIRKPSSPSMATSTKSWVRRFPGGGEQSFELQVGEPEG